MILDSDLARIFGVETKAFNRAVKRNFERFPQAFCFRLTAAEYQILKRQTGASRSHGGRRKLPLAFTENGAIMAASILASPEAIRVSVFVVRARDLKMAKNDMARFVRRSKAMIFSSATNNVLKRKITETLLAKERENRGNEILRRFSTPKRRQ